MPVDPVALREYVDAKGRSPFAHWFNDLNATAAARVATALYRLGQGNLSRVEGVGGGVHEIKVDFGPGYRVYLGIEGGRGVVLLGGSSKKRQAAAIAAAHDRWGEYKRRVRGGKGSGTEQRVP